MTRPRQDLLVLAPLAVEAIAIARARGLRVERTGMGPDKARRAAERFAGDRADMIAVVGLAGALDDSLEPGDVVVADEIREGDRRIPCEGAAEIAALLRREGIRAVVGPIASSETLVTGTRRAELATSGARAVDMESAWLAPLAAGRRFAVIRAVVDTPSRELSQALQTAVGGVKALRTLSRVARALEGWTKGDGAAEARA